jgi:hypothetical protein
MTKRSAVPATKNIDFKRELRDLYAPAREASLVMRIRFAPDRLRRRGGR